MGTDLGHLDLKAFLSSADEGLQDENIPSLCPSLLHSLYHSLLDLLLTTLHSHAACTSHMIVLLCVVML